MRLPIFSSSGLAAANAASSPPHMKVSVAPFAPPTPPETGASTESAPLAAAMACALRALSTSMVEESIHNAPGLAARSPHTASTGLPAGSIVTTTSAAAAAAAALSAILTPVAARRVAQFRHEIDAEDGMAGLDEIVGHRAAHIAEPDEGDGGHPAFLLVAMAKRLRHHAAKRLSIAPPSTI